MKTNLNFNSSICTSREQSERLLTLGLKKETADCYWLSNTSSIIEKTHWRIIVGEFEEDHRCIPAWSLHRLIEMMPTYIDVVGDEWALNIIQGKLVAYTTDEKDNFLVAQGAISLYESIIATIEWLIQAGHFNKEYLEK